MVFVDDLDAPELSDVDHHHLERALRLREGDPIVVGDGRGRWCPSTLPPSGAPLARAGAIRAEPPAPIPLTVAFALVKTGKPEVIVQKLTELGIDRIVPFEAVRSVVRWDDAKATRALTRLQTVAREAAMQCHRAWLPTVTPVVKLGQVTALATSPGAAIADRAGGLLTPCHTTVLVGPEGGWAPEELAHGAETVTLSGHVLRAETAAIVAGALMAAMRDGRLGRST